MNGILILVITSSCNLSNHNSSCDALTGACLHVNKVQNTTMEKNQVSDRNSKLIYFYDPLCGWCFGFSPVMSQVKAEYGHLLEIEVVSGGLFLESYAGAINELAPHIKNGAYKLVESRTGVKFGKPFLDDVFGEGNLILNSLPPTIALSIIKEEYPEQQLKFASMLLDHVYVDGIDPTNEDELANCAAKIGIDKVQFTTKMKDAKYRNAAIKEFETFRSNRFSAMPAVVLIKDGEEQLISQGYASFNSIKTKLDHALVH